MLWNPSQDLHLCRITYPIQNIKDELVTVIEQLNCVEANNMKLALMYFIEIVCESAFND